MELAEQAEEWLLDEVPDRFPLAYRRELEEMGLLDGYKARNLRRLMYRGVEPL